MRISTVVAFAAFAAAIAACGPAQPSSTSQARGRTVVTSTSTAAPSPGSTVSSPSETPPLTTTPTHSKSTSITQPTPSPTATKKPAPNPMNVTLRRGDHGPKVVALQKRLESLGYYIGGANGDFGSQTEQAVMAFQKVSNTGRDGVYGPQTAAALAKGVRPSAKTHSGHVLEVDKETQTLRVVDDGVVKQILNVSAGGGYEYTNPKTGAHGVADTPSGDFNVYYVFSPDRIWQKGPLGKMYRPYYFTGGVAFHGVPDGGIGATGASHGCVRLSVANMDHVADSGIVKQGARVVVY